jgi:hypothetical protein
VGLFKLVRQHVLEMCNSFSDSLDRYVIIDGTKKEEVRKMLKMVAGHARGHIEQIKETKRIHSID